MAMFISEKIRYCRLSLEMSQRELAQEVGVSLRMITDYETGEAIPRRSTLSNLSRVLHVSVSYLLDNSLDLPDDEFYEECYQHLLAKYRRTG